MNNYDLAVLRKNNYNNAIAGYQSIDFWDISRENFLRYVEEAIFRGVDPEVHPDFQKATKRFLNEFERLNSNAPKNTKKAYERAEEQFRYFLFEFYGQDELPNFLTSELVEHYLLYRANECPVLRGGNTRLSTEERRKALDEKIQTEPDSVIFGVNANTLQQDVWFLNRYCKARSVPCPAKTERFKMLLQNLKRGKIEKKERLNKQSYPLHEKQISKLIKKLFVSNNLLFKRDLMVAVLMFEGMLRCNEVLNIRLKNIQIDEDDHSAVLELEYDKTNKSGESRFLPISSDCAAIITDFVKKTGRKLHNDGYLITPIYKGNKVGADLSPLTKTVIQDTFDRIWSMHTDLEKLGRPRLTTHSCRIGAAIYLAKSGFSAIEIMNSGRWQSLAMLMRYIKPYITTGAMSVARGKSNQLN